METAVIERIRAVSNPLTVIAIFAALAEVASTVAVAAVDPTVQRVFIWFVMGFPVLLVGLFFLTLNFNPRVLYAPSDFRDEANFLTIALGGQRLTADLDAVTRQIDEAQRELAESLRRSLGTDAARLSDLQKALSLELQSIRNQIAHTRDSADELFSEATVTAFPQSGLQARILSVVASSVGQMSPVDVARACGMSVNATERAVTRLLKRGLLRKREDGALEAIPGP